MPTLACRGLTRRPWFEERDLELAAGEVVFLTGPSGSGKSLFLRTLADLDPRDAGTLTLDARSVDDHAPEEWRRRVLYMHQSAPRLTGSVGANLTRILRLGSRSSRATDDVERVLDEVGLSADLDADRLSGGEAQRLALARAVVTDPDVYLLDEGTSGLDPDSAARIEQVLRSRVERGSSILWIAHDERIALRWGARSEPLA